MNPSLRGAPRARLPAPLSARRPEGGARRHRLRQFVLGMSLAVLSGIACAAPYTAFVGTLSGRGTSEAVDYPNVAEAEEVTVTQPAVGATRNTYARSSSIGLGVRVVDKFTGTSPEAGADIDITDLVFSALAPTGETQAWVGYGGLLEGGVHFGGSGNATGVLQVSARLLGAGVSSAVAAAYDATFAKAREAGTARPLPTGPVVVHEQLEGSALVELGRPVRFSASMFLRAGGDSAFGFYGGGTIQALFDNSFEFDPNAFFDLPAGITANSPSLGLVDNRLVGFTDDPATPPAAVPEPGSAALFALGLFGLAWSRRRRHAPHRA